MKVTLKRTVEEIDLAFGITASADCETDVEITTYPAEPDAGIMSPFFEYEFTGDIRIGDIELTDDNGEHVCSVATGNYREINIAANIKNAFADMVKWDERDNDVYDEIVEILAQLESDIFANGSFREGW